MEKKSEYNSKNRKFVVMFENKFFCFKLELYTLLEIPTVFTETSDWSFI